ncbi:MAG: T9SS type A sorting domain-containing protein [Bacteroidota bacterium]
MKTLRLLLFSFAIILSNLAFSQKYVWNVAAGDWSTPGSWSPSRTTPSINDTLIFNGSTVAAATVSFVSRDSVSRLEFINNANVVFSSVIATAGIGLITRADTNVTGTGTSFFQQFIPGDGFSHGSGSGITEVKVINSSTSLVGVANGTITNSSYNIWPRITVLNASSNAFFVQNGSKLTVSAPNPHSLSFYMATGAKARINGSIEFTNGRHKFFGADSNCVVFASGGSLTVRGMYNGSPFGLAGRDYIASFEMGSTFTGYNTSSAFGASTTIKVAFVNGSRYVHKNPTIANLFNGKEYATLVIDTVAVNDGTLNIASGCVIDSLLIRNATLVGFSGATAGSLVIRKAVIVNGGILNFGNGTASQTVAFGNNTNNPISIGGAGTIAFGTNANLIVNNPAGVSITKSLTVAGTLTLNSGNINLTNNDTITIGASITDPGTLNRVAGHFTGTGYLRRWISSSAISLGTNDGLFPVGTPTDYMPFSIGTGISSGGLIMVKPVIASGSSAISPAFYDTATNAVLVNKRQNNGWWVNQNGFSPNTFSIMGIGEAVSGAVTNVTAMRLVLNNTKAAGVAQDGAGTATLPQASRTGVSETALTNTFYLGSNATTNPLPVKFINITAKAIGQSNVIQWSTASESALSAFELEKSIDGILFHTHAATKATNTSYVKTYKITDQEGGQAYYRVKALNANGTVEYSRTVSTEGFDAQPYIIHPNPATEYIQLTIAGNTDLSNARLFNNLGEQVMFKVEPKGINVKTLIPGVYYLHIAKGNATEIVKFVKQ